MKPITVDVHAHFVPRLLIERFAAHHASFPDVRMTGDSRNPSFQFPGGDATRPLNPKVADLDDRRAWMDEAGIDHQLLGLWTDIEGY